MLLKRMLDEEGNMVGISVIHTGVGQRQNFSRRLVDIAVAEGWMTMSRGKIVLHAMEGDFAYTITAMPGRYCLFDGHFFANDPTGSEARAYIAANHADKVSPDPAWPHGYRVVTGYECVLDAEQHARWQCPAYATVSHARWQQEVSNG